MAKQKAKDAFEHHAKLKAKVAAGAPGFTQRMVDGALATATQLLDAEWVLKEKSFAGKCGPDWWEIIKKQYPMTVREDGKFVVTSEAAEWHEAMEWVYESKYDALAKVEQLINWLYSARVHKGHGSFDGDIEKLIAKDAA